MELDLQPGGTHRLGRKGTRKQLVGWGVSLESVFRYCRGWEEGFGEEAV